MPRKNPPLTGPLLSPAPDPKLDPHLQTPAALLPAQMLDGLSLHIWLLQEADERISYANPALLEHLGLSLAQLQQQGWRQQIHPLDHAEFDLRWLAAQRSGSFAMDYRLRGADGRYRWQAALLQRHRQQAGQDPVWLGSHCDIDARKHTETQLRAADELWKLALESVGDGVWDWYVQDGVELYSRRILQMYGFAETEIEPSPSELDARTHPDDREQMRLDREAHFAGRTALYSNEHRIRCKDGSWKWVHSRGMVISRDIQGRPLRMVGTHTDITQRKQAEALVWQQAHFDALTGLPNRRTLRDRLELALQAAKSSARQLAVLFIDLDHFKEVNDTLGHDMGDALLLQAAQRIRACVRAGDTVARMGGDEFTVVLGAVNGPAQAEAVARQIIQSMSAAFRLQDERVFVSASIGISLHPRDGQQIEALFKHADQALYAAKAAGRNQLGHFTPELQQAAQTRMRLNTDLRDALPHGQLSLVFQPIVELRNGRICKAEALLRWQHPSRGAISPADFVPLAESSGQIIEIGDWVFQQTATLAKRWRRLHAPELQISINKSPVQFRHHGGRGVHRQWIQTLARLGLDGGAMALEITEGLLLEGDGDVERQLQALREAGFQISLDDFGTGFSSLSYLHRYAIDLLKIDQRFVRHLHAGNKNLALCKAIITMAHELSLRVVAEGVETEEQRELLCAAGCDFAQGYLFARPAAGAGLRAIADATATTAGPGLSVSVSGPPK